MRLPGRTERRLAIAILLVAVVPLVASIFFARNLVSYTTALFYNANVGVELERSLGVYNDLAKAMKEGIRAKADAIAEKEPLRAAAILKHEPSIESELAGAFKQYPDLVEVVIRTPDGTRLGSRDRGRPVDEATERSLKVERTLAEREDAPIMTAVFAAPRARFDELEKAAAFVRDYRAIELRRFDVDRAVLLAFVALVAITVPLAYIIGTQLARQVTRRIDALAIATKAVGRGDLSVRVPEEGEDEITDLARAFNRMVGEVEESRARIEFLRRMGTWQEMARRLAHEIKNPLTPIQLAVQEAHRRYPGSDAAYTKLLDTTREIVEEEVATLRRLVGEFASFARMPRAELERADLAAFLGDQRERLSLPAAAEGTDEGTPNVSDLLSGVAMEWRVDERPMNVALDPQMMHRVLANVVGNAAQAVRGARAIGGRIELSTREDDAGFVIDVDDDGPGVPEEQRAQIFDPYFTTKAEGTGLGLAIVKKIIVEHGGTIEALASPLGGARMRIRLPRLGTPASDAAMASSGPVSQPPPSRDGGRRGPRALP
jgi:nitrogen fixation/metabolism regulation signal transduction histidine kinase